MARIHIPNRVFPGFEIISKLKNKKLDDVVNSLNKMPIGIDFEDAIEELDKILGQDRGYEVLDTIRSFSSLVESNDTDINDVAINLTDSFIELSKTNMSLNQKTILSDNLFKILSNYSVISNILKSRELLLSNENNFIDLEAMTDIRVIFDDELSKKERMGMVLHKLFFEYTRNSETKELHLTLDLDDLKKVKSEIDKAIRKEELITKDYKDNIKFIS
ncbi:hypothetical protein WNY78_02190 [Psychroserpens sp. AS72]|uniref:hypothetical protein n=1 Tax=Psychroserpens sp. AS72 TaxID=3135775 RepID=UPI00317C2F18